MSWQKPTTWDERFRQALALLCDSVPPEACVLDWLKPGSDGYDLQSWASENCRLAWAQGIVAIEAAMTLADYPAEGPIHAERVAAADARNECARLLEEGAARLLQPKRTNEVDRHVADVLQSYAAQMREMK